MNEATIEPRCRVCADETTRKSVNDLLAKGMTFASIARAVGGTSSSISVDSVRRHSDRHFPVQDAAHATYRAIIEKRAREAQVDFIDGVASAVTPLAFLDVVVQKAYAQMIDGRTEVSIQSGISAASKLQEIAAESHEDAEIANAYVQLDQIMRAVREVVPEELWPKLVERLENDEGAPAP